MFGDRAIADITLNIPRPYKDGMAEEWMSSHQLKFGAGESVGYAIVLRSTQNWSEQLASLSTGDAIELN